MESLSDTIRSLLMQFHDRVLVKTPKSVFRFMTLLGLYSLFRHSLSLVGFFFRHLFRPLFQSKNRLFQKYSNGSLGSEGSWAVITGGSDGLGLAASKKLAREGFNICIVSRNGDKIKQKLSEIWQECRKGDRDFQTLAVVADFSKLQTLEDYNREIGDKVKHLDIGVLVLNAGHVCFGPFAETEDALIEKTFQINTMHTLYTLKTLIK